MANKELAAAGLELIAQNLGPEETVALMLETVGEETWQAFLSGMTRQSDLLPNAKEIIRKLLSWHLKQSGPHTYGVEIKPEILIAYLLHKICGLPIKQIVRLYPKGLPPSPSQLDNTLAGVEIRLRAHLPPTIAGLSSPDPQIPLPPRPV